MGLIKCLSSGQQNMLKGPEQPLPGVVRQRVEARGRKVRRWRRGCMVEGKEVGWMRCGR